jgi:ketosteroid isomerase-like protein
VPRRVVRAFYAAFNSQDLDALVETLHPDVVIEGGRGAKVGREEAREWATFKPGGVQQRQVVDELIDVGAGVLALNRRQWYWDGTDDLAAEDEMSYLFTIKAGLIARWQSFDGWAAGRAAAGLPAED